MKKSYFEDFNEVAGMALSYRSAKPMLVALHYDMFTAIELGLDSAELLSAAKGLDLRATRLLLDAVAALGHLRKRGGLYRNTRRSKRLLVDTSPEYIGDSLKYQEHTWDAWSDLRYVIKEGKPRQGLRDWIDKGFFTSDYIKAMGDVSREAAKELASKLTWTGVERTLDVGSGAGNFSAAFVDAAPGVRATLLDLPKPLAVARGLLERRKDAGRFDFRAADFMTESFGAGEFDLVLLSNVTRVEDEATNRMLVRKAVAAMKKGGRLVIHDYVIEADRTHPRFSALLGLHLLVFTGKGAVYTRDEYAGWMKEEGLRRAPDIPIGRASIHPSVAVIGRKS